MVGACSAYKMLAGKLETKTQHGMRRRRPGCHGNNNNITRRYRLK